MLAIFTTQIPFYPYFTGETRFTTPESLDLICFQSSGLHTTMLMHSPQFKGKCEYRAAIMASLQV